MKSPTTRWIDTKDNNINSVIEKFLADTEEKRNETGVSSININTTKVFQENMMFSFDGKEIEYNLIEYSYDSVMPGLTPIDERTSVVSGFILIYSKNNQVNYIIDRNSPALTELRWLMGYTSRDKGAIEKVESNIHSDLFIWIISKLFNADNVFRIPQKSGEDITLTLNSIIGFKGQTDDMISFVSADGDSVLNILSTLSFLLESNMLQQIKLRLEFAEHENIELTLKDIQTIYANEKKYDGPYEDYVNRLQTSCELYLLVYLEILPLINNLYQQDLGKSWGEDEKKVFLKLVGDKLIAKVEEKTN